MKFESCHLFEVIEIEIFFIDFEKFVGIEFLNFKKFLAYLIGVFEIVCLEALLHPRLEVIIHRREIEKAFSLREFES